MYKFTIIVAGLLSISGLLTACNSGEKAVKEAENEVFAIHDEVMPKIDDIMKLKKQLKQRIALLDSLKATASATTAVRTDDDREEASRLSRNLIVADSIMMDWMSHYDGDTLTKLSSDDALRYLGAQKDQITDVKTKVNTSIEQAKQYLGKK